VNFVFSLFASGPRSPFNGLTGFKIFVHLKEMLYFEAVEFGNMMNIAEVLHAGVTCRDAQQLVIAPRFVGHPEHSHGSARNHYARESGFLNEYESIEWVPIKAESVIDESVVVGITR